MMRNPEFTEPRSPRESQMIPWWFIIAGILIGLAFIVWPKWERYRLEKAAATAYCKEQGQTEADSVWYNTERDDIKAYDRVWFCRPSYKDVPKALTGGSK